MKKFIFIIVLMWVIAGFFFPIIPFVAKNGWHGKGGEFCGIVYQPNCDKDGIRFFTISQIKDIIQNHAY